MKKRGGEARLAGVQGVVAEVIHMVMLDKVLHLYPNVEEASWDG
jgi:anti-anti-sigma regulatory factor